MSTVKSLILVFKDEDDTDCKFTFGDVKDDLTQEEVTDVMTQIIEDDTILTAEGKHLTSIGNCYYRTVTEEPLETADGE